MYRTALVAIVLLAFLTCQSDTKSFAEKKKANNLLGKLNGVYGFVSESTVLIKPRKEILRRSEPEWSGVWHFQNSHYSRILMKRKRDRFYNSTKLEDLGFEGFSGTYKAEGQGILLNQEYSFSPYDVGGSVYLEYQVKGDRLILTQSLFPHVEDLREGTITIVLRRLDKS